MTYKVLIVGFLPFILAGCGAAGDGKDNTKSEMSLTLGTSAQEIFAEQFTGEYAMNINDCATSVTTGTMTLRGDRFRLTETTCDMSDFKANSNGDEVTVSLENCTAEGTPQPDQNMTFKRVEEGLQVNGGDGQNYLMNYCGK